MARRWRISLSRRTDSFLLSVICFLRLTMQTQHSFHAKRLIPRNVVVKLISLDTFYRQGRYQIAQTESILGFDSDYRNIKASAVSRGPLAYAHSHTVNSSGYAADQLPNRPVLKGRGPLWARGNGRAIGARRGRGAGASAYALSGGLWWRIFRR